MRNEYLVAENRTLCQQITGCLRRSVNAREDKRLGFLTKREQYVVGKEHMQKIESKHITLRTRIKRLVRRTICFSKTEWMHDLVIGLFVNRYEFGRAI